MAKAFRYWQCAGRVAACTAAPPLTWQLDGNKQPMKRNPMFLGFFFAEPNGTGGRVSCPQVNLKNLNVENARIIGSQARATNKMMSPASDLVCNVFPLMSPTKSSRDSAVEAHIFSFAVYMT